jgi:tetratricopeptide (TPR) repeat protein
MVVVVAGLVLTAGGALHLSRELPRQASLAPLTRSGGWQRAMVAEGVAPVARKVEQATRRAGTPAALEDGARLLAALSGATGDQEVANALREKAVTFAHAALETSPGRVQAHFVAAAALVELDRDEQLASWHASRAATLDPHRASLRHRLGLLALRQGHESAAADHFRMALMANPGSGPALFDALEAAGGSLDPATLTPETPRAQVALGRWLEQSGHTLEAGLAFETALALADAAGAVDTGPDLAFWAYRQLQGYYLRQGRWTEVEALAAARLEAELFADTAQEATLHFDRGVALFRGKVYGLALPDLERAVTLRPEAVLYLDHLAGTFSALGRHHEAARAWSEALSVPRRSESDQRREVPMRLKRARSLSAAGRPQEALTEIRRVLMSDPLNAAARQMAQELAYE